VLFLTTFFFVLHRRFWRMCYFRRHDGILHMDAEDKRTNSFENCWIDREGRKVPINSSVCVITLP